MTAETIAQGLGKATRKTGGGFMAQCPCHDDLTASLSIDEKGGKLLFKCMASCSQDAVVSALKDRGLWPEPAREPEPPKIKQKVVARYDYHGLDGALLYWKERLEPGREGRSKEFRFYHGAKQAGRRGDPVLYHLPDVLTASTVFICEGERKADVVKTWGLVGTSLDSGASSPINQAAVEALTGKHIVILPDNDEPGRAYAGKICAALEGKVASIKIVVLDGLPVKGDIVDWIKTPGNDKERLLNLTRLADSGPEEQKPTLFEKASDFLTQKIKIEYLIQKLFAVLTLISITGPSGQYKSFVALSIACCVATGRDWYGRAVKRGAVLYLAGEGREGIKLRVTAWMMANGLTPVDLDAFYLSKNTLMMDGSNIGQIVTEMIGIDVALIIVDTLARHISGHENDALDMGSFVNHVDALKYRLGAAAIIVHHTGHQDQTRGRGSSAFKAALDTEILCDKGMLIFSKMKDAEPPEAIQFKLAQVVIGTDDETGEPITSAVVEYGERAKKNQTASLTRFEAQALEALITVCVAENNLENRMYAGSLEEWRQEFYRLRRLEIGCPDDQTEQKRQQDTLKKAYQRATGTGDQTTGLRGKGIVAFTERGAVPLHISDQDRIFKTILSTGTRDNSGTLTGHVPELETGHTGHPLYKGVPCPADLSPIVESFTEFDFAESQP